MRLKSKRVLMTGATGFMGSAIVREFAAQGADLVLTSRSPDKLAALAAEAQGAGARTATIVADMMIADDMSRLADAAWDAFGGIDVVVLNGMTPPDMVGDILSTDDEHWEMAFRPVVWGPLRLMRALAPKMIEAGSGSIISLVSATGYHPTPGYDAYGMAKGGLLLLTMYMAKEWGPHGIRANAVSPGSIVTTRGTDASRQNATRLGVFQRISLGRSGTNDEVVGTMTFLASDESSFTSGQLFKIDGGRF